VRAASALGAAPSEPARQGHTRTLRRQSPLASGPAAAEYVDPAALPPPRPDQSVSIPPLVVARGGRSPVVPAGYRVTLFAEGLKDARMLLALPDKVKATVVPDDAGQTIWRIGHE